MQKTSTPRNKYGQPRKQYGFSLTDEGYKSVQQVQAFLGNSNPSEAVEDIFRMLAQALEELREEEREIQEQRSEEISSLEQAFEDNEPF